MSGPTSRSPEDFVHGGCPGGRTGPVGLWGPPWLLQGPDMESKGWEE